MPGSLIASHIWVTRGSCYSSSFESWWYRERQWWLFGIDTLGKVGPKALIVFVVVTLY